MSRREKSGATLPGLPASVRKRRCAVYTRKSTDEGLDQAFNTLDAQRDACEAYAASQRAEGWVLVPDRYDDGGFSGGTLERPALRRLLGDVERGLVDVVVTYEARWNSPSGPAASRRRPVWSMHAESGLPNCFVLAL